MLEGSGVLGSCRAWLAISEVGCSRCSLFGVLGLDSSWLPTASIVPVTGPGNVSRGMKHVLGILITTFGSSEHGEDLDAVLAESCQGATCWCVRTWLD